MKQYILYSLFLLYAYGLSAQSSHEEVSNAVKDYVEAFYYGDTAKIHQSVSRDVVKYGYYIPKGKEWI